MSEIPQKKKKSRNWSNNRVWVFMYSVLLWEKIQKEFPQIADDYRNGLIMKEIIEKYKMDIYYNSSSLPAIIKAVSFALRGYQSEIKTTPILAYEWLLWLDESIKIGKDHKRITNTKNGIANFKQKKGIFSLSFEEHSEKSRRIGIKLWKDGKWIHGMTPEQKKRRIEASAKTNGFILFSDEEKRRIIELAKMEENKKIFNGKIYPNNHIILDRINEEFHGWQPVRKLRSIEYIVRKLHLNDQK